MAVQIAGFIFPSSDRAVTEDAPHYRRIEPVNAVDTLTLQVKASAALVGVALLNRIAERNRDRLVPVIDRVLTEFGHSQHLVLNELRLDLGRFDWQLQGIEDRLERALRLALSEALEARRTVVAKQGSARTTPTVLQAEEPTHFLLAAFEHYLDRGNWRYAGCVSPGFAPVDLFYQLLADEPSALADLLRRRSKDSHLVTRLVYLIGHEGCRDLLDALKPGDAALILPVINAVVGAHEEARFEGLAVKDPGPLMWEVVVPAVFAMHETNPATPGHPDAATANSRSEPPVPTAALVRRLREALSRPASTGSPADAFAATFERTLRSSLSSFGNRDALSVLAEVLEGEVLVRHDVLRALIDTTREQHPYLFPWLLRRLEREKLYDPLAPENRQAGAKRPPRHGHAIQHTQDPGSHPSGPAALQPDVSGKPHADSRVAHDGHGHSSTPDAASLGPLPGDPPASERDNAHLSAPDAALAHLAQLMELAASHRRGRYTGRLAAALTAAERSNPSALRQYLIGLAVLDPALLIGVMDFVLPRGTLFARILPPALSDVAAPLIGIAVPNHGEFIRIVKIAAGIDASTTVSDLVSRVLESTAEERGIEPSRLRWQWIGNCWALEPMPMRLVTSLARTQETLGLTTSSALALCTIEAIWTGNARLEATRHAEIITSLFSSLRDIGAGRLLSRLRALRPVPHIEALLRRLPVSILRAVFGLLAGSRAGDGRSGDGQDEPSVLAKAIVVFVRDGPESQLSYAPSPGAYLRDPVRQPGPTHARAGLADKAAPSGVSSASNLPNIEAASQARFVSPAGALAFEDTWTRAFFGLILSSLDRLSPEQLRAHLQDISSEQAMDALLGLADLRTLRKFVNALLVGSEETWRGRLHYADRSRVAKAIVVLARNDRESPAYHSLALEMSRNAPRQGVASEQPVPPPPIVETSSSQPDRPHGNEGAGLPELPALNRAQLMTYLQAIEHGPGIEAALRLVDADGLAGMLATLLADEAGTAKERVVHLERSRLVSMIAAIARHGQASAALKVAAQDRTNTPVRTSGNLFLRRKTVIADLAAALSDETISLIRAIDPGLLAGRIEDRTPGHTDGTDARALKALRRLLPLVPLESDSPGANLAAPIGIESEPSRGKAISEMGGSNPMQARDTHRRSLGLVALALTASARLSTARGQVVLRRYMRAFAPPAGGSSRTTSVTVASEPMRGSSARIAEADRSSPAGDDLAQLLGIGSPEAVVQLRRIVSGRDAHVLLDGLDTRSRTRLLRLLAPRSAATMVAIGRLVAARTGATRKDTWQHLLTLAALGPDSVNGMLNQLDLFRSRPRRSDPSGEPPPDRMKWQATRTSQAPVDEAIWTGSAGLVIVAPFLPSLFSRLELLRNGSDGRPQWSSEMARARAVHLLQWLVDERTACPEPQLALHKLLCGMTPADMVIPLFEPTEFERATCMSLLESVISSWPRLNSSSVAALRETFLVREGRLSTNQTGWNLEVERKTVDVLLGDLPWSFSMVFHAWMPAPLSVIW